VVLYAGLAIPEFGVGVFVAGHQGNNMAYIPMNNLVRFEFFVKYRSSL